MGGCVTVPNQPNHINVIARGSSPQRYSARINMPVQSNHEIIQRKISPIK